MRHYLLALMALMIFTISCQQSELIEETVPTNEQETAIDARWSTTQQYGQLMRWNYFMQNNAWGQVWGSSWQQMWHNNQNSWGVTANHPWSSSQVRSFPSIVIGRHFGTAPSNMRGLPKKVSNLGNMWCRWDQEIEEMQRGNATLDIYFDSQANPGYREGQKALMIWVDRIGGQQPIGNWVGEKKVDGEEYNVYIGYNANGTLVMSFLQVNRTGKLSTNLKPFVNYCKNKGWIKNWEYAVSFQAGWEFMGSGKAKTTKFNLSGI